ncbi:DUF4265 domain-containing protein [Corallococcus sp. ZKHCc1 1396]|uniref:DUF4265 domain-containing protein n=1 Tax=Corallococcus soli TaxID=2710757 RepID=A0ABR9Q0C0_9BACT|nr:DUF4265 domain-containing protein [Corallococcus soli]
MQVELRVRGVPEVPDVTEDVPVEVMGENRFRVLLSPGMVEGLAAGDEFEVIDEESREFRVLKRGGNFCVWYFFPEEEMNRGSEYKLLRERIAEIGGRLDGGGSTTLIFTVPAASGFDRIADFFDEAVLLVKGASWQFSNAYDPILRVPLPWWSREVKG